MYRTIFLIFFSFFTMILTAQKQNVKKGDKRVDFAFMPVLMYNRSFGGQLGVMTNAFFDVNKKDTVSAASSVAFIGNYFTNKTYFTGLFGQFHLNEDKWRIKAGTGYANVNFQTYFEIPPEFSDIIIPVEDGLFIDYNTKRLFVFGEISRKVIPNLYLGLRSVYSRAYTEFDTALKPDEDMKLVGFGASVQFDTRDYVLNPSKGINTRIQSMSYLESLGSSNTFHRINLEYNHFFNLGEKSVLLARFYSMLSVGDDVPFSGKNVIGRDDLRGYTNGKHRANQVYDIQSEYRWNFYKKWGMVAFTGLALATDNWKGDNYSGVLPSAGAGLRYKVIPKRGINIGLEAAVGKEDWGVYFRIGETFTR